MNITFLGHACFMLESAGYRIVIDPYKLDCLPPLQSEAHAVFCSHGHFDHCYRDAVTLLPAKESPFTVTEIAAFHDEKGGTLRGSNLIRVFEAEGLRIVHAGDIGHPLSKEQLCAIGHADVLLIPVGGYYTVDAAGAKQIADAIGANTVVPMHYYCPKTYGKRFSEIAPADDFLALYPDNEIVRLKSSSFAAKKSDLRCVVVPHFAD